MSAEVKSAEKVRKVGQYIIGETLGKGGFSWVKKGVDEKTKVPVALKFMMRADKPFLRDQGKQVHTEIKSMIRIDNRHVMKLYAYNLHCQYPEKSGKKLSTILLVLEYCPGGELFDILYYTHQLDTVTARTYFIQILKGLKACHNAGVAHRDIKPQNLLLDGRFQLKITDFELSYIAKENKDLEGTLIRTRGVGTRGYQAPELLKGERYTKVCDIFSCGVVLFILLTGYPPFEQAWREDKWYRPMCELNPEAFWKAHKKAKIDEDARDLLTGMLAYKARERLTLDECMKHRWVADQKTYNPRQLATVVKRKHKDARKRRRKDRKKMQDLETSVKERKKRIICRCWMKHHAQTWSKTRCPCCNGINEVSTFEVYRCPCCSGIKDVSSSERKVPVVKIFHPNLLTFYAWKFQLNEAYDAAVNVFDVALEGKSWTNTSPGNPWDVTTVIKASDGVSDQEFTVALFVREIKGTGVIAFKFKRSQGDSIAFGRIWNAAENCLMSYRENLFFDSLDESVETIEENKEPPLVVD